MSDSKCQTLHINNLAPRIKAIPSRENLWFHQDSARTHTLRMSMDAVGNVLDGHAISRPGDVKSCSFPLQTFFYEVTCVRYKTNHTE